MLLGNLGKRVYKNVHDTPEILPLVFMVGVAHVAGLTIGYHKLFHGWDVHPEFHKTNPFPMLNIKSADEAKWHRADIRNWSPRVFHDDPKV
eukprot:ANDGO_07876.mRNA.1 hypothetical protein